MLNIYLNAHPFRPPRRPLERGWRKAKEGTPGPPKVPLRQEVVSVTGQRRGQRIVVPVKKLFAREKRPYGLGMVGKLTNRTYRKRIDSYVKRQIEDMDDHRHLHPPSSSSSCVWLMRAPPPLPLCPSNLHPLLCPPGPFSLTGSPLSICSSPSWLCVSMASRQSASPSMRRLIL